MGTLALGIFFDLMWASGSMMQSVALLWLVLGALIAFTPGAFARRNAIGYVALGSAALLSLSAFFLSPSDLTGLVLFVAVPALLMMAAIWARFGHAEEREHIFAIEYLLGWFLRPFHRVGRFFGALRALLPSRSNPVALRVLLGLLISLPLLAVVLVLLFEADAYFSQAFADLLQTVRIDIVLVHAVRILVPMMLFFSFLSSYAKEPFLVEQKPPNAYWDPVIVGTLLTVMLAVYAVFCGFQFVYLFGGRAGFEARGLTYAEYARRGFAEMNMVCAINLFLYWIAQRFTAEGRWIRIALAGLVAATAVMLASAALRLWLYVDAYGLTEARLQAAWMIALMAMIAVACAVRLVARRLPIVRAAVAIGMAWLVLFTFLSPDALVARYNAARLVRQVEARQDYDRDLVQYMSSLSHDAVPTLIELDARLQDAELHEQLNWRATALHTMRRDGAWMPVAMSRALRLLEAAGYRVDMDRDM